jgi:hypothetical protein
MEAVQDPQIQKMEAAQDEQQGQRLQLHGATNQEQLHMNQTELMSKKNFLQKKESFLARVGAAACACPHKEEGKFKKKEKEKGSSPLKSLSAVRSA